MPRIIYLWNTKQYTHIMMHFSVQPWENQGEKNEKREFKLVTQYFNSLENNVFIIFMITINFHEQQ